MAARDLRWDDNLDPEIGILVATLVGSTQKWRDNLELPEAAAVTWQPYPDGPSIGGLILHMASCELYWIGEIAELQKVSDDEPSRTYDKTVDQYLPHWPTPPAEPIEWYFAIQDDVRSRILNLIARHGAPDTVHQTTRSSMTYRWILAHIIQHDSYTGGQAVVLHEMYKKLMN
jgi:uncharacterized damage-inducible protein DinB